MKNQSKDEPTEIRAILDAYSMGDLNIEIDVRLLKFLRMTRTLGNYILDKGEDWRTGEGAELVDIYQSLVERLK